MSTSLILIILLIVGAGAYGLAASRAVRMSGGKLSALHSRPGYYGAYAAIWAILPAALVLAVWLVASPMIVERTVRGGFPDDVKSMPVAEQNLAYGMINAIARGLPMLSAEDTAALSSGSVDVRAKLAEKGVPLAGDVQPYMLEAARTLNAETGTSRLAMTAVVALLALGGAAVALRSVAPRFRARNRVERVILWALVAASSIAILTTVGIVLSMLTEAAHFFREIPPLEFFFGTVWDPRFSAPGRIGGAEGQFGLIPLLWGTLYISLVALLVAVPIGLYSAIYMSEYASERIRAVVKPALEVLAGIPTIVYGFFALVTFGPFLRSVGAIANFDISPSSVLTAGIVMGIMIIPFVSSLSDDIISAVPQSLREGAYGLGSTQSETIKQVILPAALPGVVGAVLLAASRAIGETMIVVLAAGIAANMTFNPAETVTTITVKIVSQLTGDLEFDSPQTLVAFALGLTLFAVTLGLNVFALYIVRKYREQYE